MSVNIVIGLAVLSTSSLYAANKVSSDSLLLVDESISRWQITLDDLSPTHVWQQLAGLNTFTPAITNQHLLLGSSAGLYALNHSDGAIRWHIADDETIYTPTINNGIAYAASQNGLLRAINIKHGTSIWQTALPGWIYTPALAENTLITGGSDSTLWGINHDTGAILWQFTMPGELASPPKSHTENRVIASTFSSDLLVVNGSDGKLIWQTALSSPATQITSTKKIIFTSGYDGIVQAFNAQTGDPLWQHVTHGDRNQRLQITDKGLLVINHRGYQRLNLLNGLVLASHDVTGEPVGSIQQIKDDYWIFYRQAGKTIPLKLTL